MTKRQPPRRRLSEKKIGLFASGRLAQSIFARWPSLTGGIGPVCAPTLRLAARYSNALRCGTPSEPEGLAGCNLLLIHGGVSAAREAAALLDSQRFHWERIPVVMIGESLETDALACFVRLRAPTAAAVPVRHARTPSLMCCGDATALGAIRRWCRAGHARVFEIRQTHAAGLLAACSAAELGAFAVAESVVKRLRDAGLPQVQARQITRSILDVALRDYFAHGLSSLPAATVDLLKHHDWGRANSKKDEDPFFGKALPGLLQSIRPRTTAR